MKGSDLLIVRHLGKSFGRHEVLRDIDLVVQKGDVTCMIGASGSGKSTFLRCINLLETPDDGHIFFFVDNTYKPLSYNRMLIRNENSDLWHHGFVPVFFGFKFHSAIENNLFF